MNRSILKSLVLILSCLCGSTLTAKHPTAMQWSCLELTFHSSKAYVNPLYDASLEAIFISPSGEEFRKTGFWDGEGCWKIRFMPEQRGRWSYRTLCSDTLNKALHHQQGSFECKRNPSPLPIYAKGKIIHRLGDYHFCYADQTPFFYLGCTTWNGAMRSTDEEWARYLQHRVDNHYTVIQFVTTQWRGLPAEELNPPAFTGEELLQVNPLFFQRLDRKIEQINQAGLVASPVMLWAYPGKINPGYGLPTESAIKLAEYIKARYDAFHVIWILGGDGNFTGGNQAKWNHIGQSVFGDPQRRQGVVTLHAGGGQWYGSDFDSQEWLDMISYQTGHSNSESKVRWKTQGPVVTNWIRITPRPLIDTEPVYEAQGKTENDYEVRKSVLWSIFSAPVAGVGYGAWSTWPWLRVGEKSFNHGMKHPSQYDWEDGIHSKASTQIGNLHLFFSKFKWWSLRPAPDLLGVPKDDNDVLKTIMVLADSQQRLILVYTPVPQNVRLKNPTKHQFKRAQWYNPASGEYQTAKVSYDADCMEARSESDTDAILILR
ncbi:MAG: DUF4038 domain-containing protein [Alistipes sp.]|nr:DUF4038 domain-containing protein [Alistipes sp.]